MPPVHREYHPVIEVEEVSRDCGDEAIKPPEDINKARKITIPPPPFAALMMPASRAALIAVLDENGCLLPVFTAADLLRGCKYFWSTSQD